MIHFIKVLPSPFKCIAELLRRSVENHWVRYCLKKIGEKTKWKGGKVFIYGVKIFQGSVENPLIKSIRYRRGLFQDP
jgi:aspartyl aminopeptidase